jgi:hypothetical protein
MVPGRERRRLKVERGVMRVVATGGSIGIAVVLGDFAGATESLGPTTPGSHSRLWRIAEVGEDLRGRAWAIDARDVSGHQTPPEMSGSSSHPLSPAQAFHSRSRSCADSFVHGTR